MHKGREHAARAPRFAAAGLTAGSIALLLSACAAVPPQEPVFESIDERTGTTVTVISAPIELVATQPRGRDADPFAFLAPFETNRTGSRERLLWVSVPGDGVREPPALFADGASISLEPYAFDLDALALTKPPYSAPAPWNSQFYYRLDAAALEGLSTAHSIAIAVTYDKTGLERFATSSPPLAVLVEFARRTSD